MNLLEVERSFQEVFDLNEIKETLETTFVNLIRKFPEEHDNLHLLYDEGRLKFRFSGITLHILNESKRKPFFMAHLAISDINNKVRDIAWYEIEYSLSGEILDNYFDFY